MAVCVCMDVCMYVNSCVCACCTALYAWCCVSQIGGFPSFSSRVGSMAETCHLTMSRFHLFGDANHLRLRSFQPPAESREEATGARRADSRDGDASCSRPDSHEPAGWQHYHDHPSPPPAYENLKQRQLLNASLSRSILLAACLAVGRSSCRPAAWHWRPM